MIFRQLDSYSEKSKVGDLNHTLLHNKSELNVKKAELNIHIRIRHSQSEEVGLRMPKTPEIIK